MIKHAQLKKCHFFLLPWVFQFANRSMRPLESLFSFPASTQDTKPTKDPSSAPPGTSRSLLISGWYLLPSFSWWFYSRYIHWIPAPPKKSHDFGLQKTSQIPALLARALGVSGTSKPLAIKAQSSAAQHAANLLDARWADRTMDWKNLATKKKLVRRDSCRWRGVESHRSRPSASSSGQSWWDTDEIDQTQDYRPGASVDGRKPAPVDMENVPLCTGFHTS